jgi:hypothetical protein
MSKDVINQRGQPHEPPCNLRLAIHPSLHPRSRGLAGFRKESAVEEDQVALDRMLAEMDAIGRNGGIVVLPAGRRENIYAGEPMLKTLKARKTR